MQAAGCGQGSSEAQVCRLSVLFSWCEAALEGDPRLL